MTIKAFIGFPKKPNKSPGAAVARAFGMKEKPNTTEFEWLFQKTKFRVMLEDLREQMKPELREWADEVGWGYNWAIQVAVHEKRDSADYLKWISLVAVLMEAYEQTHVWFDEGTDTPQLRMKLDAFAPLKHEFKEGEPAHIEGGGIEFSEEEEEEQEEEDMFADEEPKALEVADLPPGFMDMIRNELGAGKAPEPIHLAPALEPAPAPALVPVPASEDDFDDFEDWDDEDDEDDGVEDGSQAVTWD